MPTSIKHRPSIPYRKNPFCVATLFREKKRWSPWHVICDMWHETADRWHMFFCFDIAMISCTFWYGFSTHHHTNKGWTVSWLPNATASPAMVCMHSDHSVALTQFHWCWIWIGYFPVSYRLFLVKTAYVVYTTSLNHIGLQSMKYTHYIFTDIPLHAFHSFSFSSLTLFTCRHIMLLLHYVAFHYVTSMPLKYITLHYRLTVHCTTFITYTLIILRTCRLSDK